VLLVREKTVTSHRLVISPTDIKQLTEECLSEFNNVPLYDHAGRREVIERYFHDLQAELIDRTLKLANSTNAKAAIETLRAEEFEDYASRSFGGSRWK